MAISTLEERVARNTAFQIDSEHALLALSEYKETNDVELLANRLRLGGLLDDIQAHSLNMTNIAHALNEFYKKKEMPCSVFFKESNAGVKEFYQLLRTLISLYNDVIALIALKASNAQLTQYVSSDHFRCRDWMRLRVVLKDEVLQWRKAHLGDVSDFIPDRQLRPTRLRPAQKLSILKIIKKSGPQQTFDNAESIINLCVKARVDAAQLKQIDIFN